MRIRRVAAVVMQNNEGKVLILKRSSEKKMHAGLWNLPSGGVKGRESLERAASREVFEETGIKAGKLNEGLSMEIPTKNIVVQITFFETKVNVSNIRLNDEHSEHKWVTPNEMLNYKFAISPKKVEKVLHVFDLQ